MIHDVVIKDVTPLLNEQGGILHMVREDETSLFSRFGELYFSITNPGVVKGWHRHGRQHNIFSCVRGTLRLALFDGRSGSPSNGAVQVLEFGEGHHKIVRIPAGVTYGWKNIGVTPALLVNLASEKHDPADATRVPIDSPEVPYRWQAE